MKDFFFRLVLPKYFCLLCIYLVSDFTLHAQFNEVNFERLTQLHGLPSIPVSGIVQDDRGFIWIGTTTGLYRYNGHSSKAYKADGSLYSLPVNKITQLEFIEGKVVALTEQGTFIHNTLTNQDTSIFISCEKTVKQFLVNKMTHACGDNKGGLILLSTAGLMHVDSSFQNRFNYIHPDDALLPPISGSFGRVVIPIPNGMFIVAGSQGVFKYDPIAKTIQQLQKDDYPSLNLFTDDNTVNFFETKPDEYILLSRSHKQISYFNSRDNILFSKVLDTTLQKILHWTTTVHTVNDSLYYLLSPGKGTHKVIIHYASSSIEVMPLILSQIPPTTLHLDKNQRVWLGTHNGVYRQRDVQNRIQKSKPSPDSDVPEKTPIEFEISGSYLIAGNTLGFELKIYDKLTLDYVRSVRLPSNPLRPAAGILSFAAFGRDSVLICTNGPRYFLNTKTWNITQIDPFKIGSYTWYAYLTPLSRNLYTLYNSGEVDKFDHLQKKFISLPYNKQSTKILRGPAEVAEDWAGNLWFTNHGICRYNSSLDSIDYCRQSFGDIKLDLNTVGHIIADSSNQVLWFILQNVGLIQYDPVTHAFKLFTIADGMPDQTLSGLILIDKNLWLITPSGLASISTIDYSIKKYPLGLGTSLRSNKKAFAYDDESNQLYFIHDDEIMGCQPEALLFKTSAAKLYIENISFGNENLHWPEQPTINVEGKERKIKIQLSALSLDVTSPLQYFYRNVSHSDTTWYEMSSDGITYIENLIPGNYHFQFKVSGKGNDLIPAFEELKIVVKPRFFESIYFKIGVAFCCMLLVWLLARWQIGRRKEQETIKSRLTELELQALRARMNPHFIFNCLNSINRYILKAESNKASYYLSRFARLIRHILDYSNESTISLTDELYVTQLYIELESLRLTNPIETEIIIEPNIDTDSIRIPPLFIQPYIENAIWHGLAPGKRNPKLIVRVQRDNLGYRFEVQDNGIGRKQSAKNKKPDGHQSKGLLLANETLEHFGQVSGMKTSIDIIDLKTDEGIAAGTRVMIQILPE